MPDVECVLDARIQLGESPLWSVDEQKLYWVDTLGPTLNRFDPASGENRSWTMPADIGCCALRASGGLVVALRGGFHGFDPETGKLELLARVEAERPALRLNDGRCDPAGRLWAGTVRTPHIPDGPCAALFRLDPDGGCHRKVEGLMTSNGLAFSPDGKTMYHSDSHPSVQTIWAYDFDASSGEIANRRVFASTHDLPGRPDGAAVDSEGCYWGANIDGSQIVRYTPEGEIERKVALPVTKPSMCCFGGPDLDIVYVTSIRPDDAQRDDPMGGSLFAFAAGVRGLPEPRFAG